MIKQAVFDKILDVTLENIAQEVGTLLGQEFACSPHAGSFVSQEDYLDQVNQVSVLSKLVISGDATGEAYIITNVGDSITLGGTLIMLPADEIEERREKKNFDGEAADAFGEIANIIAGCYTASFLERLSQNFHIKRTDVELFDPRGMDPARSPVQPGHYYRSSVPLKLEEQKLGRMDVLFPAEALGLEVPGQPAAAPPTAETPATDAANQPAAASPAEETPASGTSQPTPPAADPLGDPTTAQPGTTGWPVETEGPASNSPTSQTVQQTAPEATNSPLQPAIASAAPVILIAAETQEEAQGFASHLTGLELSTLCLNGQDNLKEELRGKDVQVAFIIMKEVGDRGLAFIIKVQSAVPENTPIIVAGPQWTKKTVLQAVKYGACDIMLTPPLPNELMEKVQQHMAPN